MPKTLRGRASTFGRDPKTGYVDPGDNGQNASGLPQSTPGIATRNRNWLGGYGYLTAPNGFRQLVRQVDMGPGIMKRAMDINSPAARQAGYKQGDRFPTDQGNWTFEYIGKKAPKGNTGAPLTPKGTKGATAAGARSLDSAPNAAATDSSTASADSTKLNVLAWYLARHKGKTGEVGKQLLGL